MRKMDSKYYDSLNKRILYLILFKFKYIYNLNEILFLNHLKLLYNSNTLI